MYVCFYQYTKSRICFNKCGFGATDRGRTGTILLPRDFKSLASAYSATVAFVKKPAYACRLLEAPPRFELGRKGFADLCLTAWLWCRIWSGRRDSNSRHLPWQGNALPLSHSRALPYKCYQKNINKAIVLSQNLILIYSAEII